jgi:hypothetical protein
MVRMEQAHGAVMVMEAGTTLKVVEVESPKFEDEATTFQVTEVSGQAILLDAAMVSYMTKGFKVDHTDDVVLGLGTPTVTVTTFLDRK